MAGFSRNFRMSSVVRETARRPGVGAGGGAGQARRLRAQRSRVSRWAARGRLTVDSCTRAEHGHVARRVHAQAAPTRCGVSEVSGPRRRKAPA